MPKRQSNVLNEEKMKIEEEEDQSWDGALR